MVRWLRDLLVDTPARIGWVWTLVARVLGAVVVGVPFLLFTDLSLGDVLCGIAVAFGLAYGAGWVWQWRIRKRTAVSR